MAGDATARDAYRKVIRAIAAATIEFSQPTEKLLINLRKTLHIDEEYHVGCLMEALEDEDVTNIRTALESGGGAAAAHTPYAAPAPPHRTSTFAAPLPKAPAPPSRKDAPPGFQKKTKGGRQPILKAATPVPTLPPEPLQPAPSLSKRLSRKPLPPPPATLHLPPPSAPAAPSPPPPTAKPSALPSTSSRPPYSPAEFRTRLSTATEGVLHAMLGEMRIREAEINAELEEIDQLEAAAAAAVQEAPAPLPAPAPSHTQGRKAPGSAVQVNVAVGMSAQELQAMLRSLVDREEQIVDEILDMDISDEEDLDQEGTLRLRWYRLGRREAQIQAEVAAIDREIEVSAG